MRTTHKLMANTLLALLPFLAAPLHAEETPAANDSITLTCGGIGSDESSRMLGEVKQHALTLLFVSDDGHYMSDVETRIEAVKGGQSAEQACGPIGQVDVTKAGNYKIVTRFGDQTQNKTMALKPTGGKRLTFRFKAD